jgi:predicted NACHT family NTPase
LAHRQMFASVVEGKIRDINSNEKWGDYRFTELEAEVEAEGERRNLSLNPFRRRTRSGLRREKSLTRAIELSRERLIQLEGEPGSGKSVALRFVARTLAERASRSRRLRSVIPLYLNLKGLSRKPDEAVDQNLIKSFVLRTLNNANDRDVERFLEEEFSLGMKEGTWLFLFDSFDEIPEVLSSTEADEAIKSYAGAISDFMSGMNRCRGVVASRHFRGPGQSRWPRFRILPLTEPRRLEPIKQALVWLFFLI